jgi:hypothetical protein
MTVQIAESILCSTQQQSKQNAPQNFVYNNINYAVRVHSFQPNVLVNIGVKLSRPKVQPNFGLLLNTATVLSKHFVVQRYVAIIGVCH